MCYRFELLEFNDCLFQNIDATYILHLEGNGRIDHIHEQLKSYHPSKKVYIVYNKGYKTCAKDLHIQSSGYDITHANITAFEHAQHYKHVLVLEDDFIFNKDVVDHAKHVDTFLERDTTFVYQLGSNPIIALPIDRYHYRVLGLLGHANMYSSSCRKQLIHDFDNGKIKGSIDSYLFKTFSIYMYHKPLCYQTFPITENRKSWSGIIPDTFISWTNLENEPEPGFTIMYWFAKLMPILLFLLWILSYMPSCTSLKGKRVR
jgi:hypothetical protein